MSKTTKELVQFLQEERVSQVRLLNVDSENALPVEKEKQFLEITKNSVATIGKTIYLSIGFMGDGKSKHIVSIIYNYIRCLHIELDNALTKEDYSFKIPDEPDFPSLDVLDSEEKSKIKEVAKYIVNVLPNIYSITQIALKNKIPYAREINIVLNSIQSFCTMISDK